MSTKCTNVLAYIIWPIAVARAVFHNDEEREKCKFHINQGLVLWLFALLSAIPIIGWIWAIFILVCWILGILNASNDDEKELPLIGACRIIK